MFHLGVFHFPLRFVEFLFSTNVAIELKHDCNSQINSLTSLTEVDDANEKKTMKDFVPNLM